MRIMIDKLYIASVIVMLCNGGFAANLLPFTFQDDDSDGVPDGYTITVTGSGASISYDADVVCGTNGPSVRMELPQEGTIKLDLTSPLSLETNKQYMFSVDMKIKDMWTTGEWNGSPYRCIITYVYGTDNSHKYAVIAGCGSSRGWVRIMRPFSTEAYPGLATSRILLRCYNMQGIIWFQNPSITEISPDADLDNRFIYEDGGVKNNFKLALAENLARGKGYTWSYDPNYPLTTDAGDVTDLTDGIYSKTGWTEKSSVGWQYFRDPITVTIDLGADNPISGVALRTAGGDAGVAYPHSVIVSVSDNGTDFFRCSELLRSTINPLPAPGYGENDERGLNYYYAAEDIATRGRYVRFDIVPPNHLFFIDEIEIYKGDDALTANHDHLLTSEYISDSLRLTQLGCYRRIRRDIECVKTAVNNSSMSTISKDAIYTKLDNISTTNSSGSFPATIDSFRAIMPLDSLHEEVYAVHAQLLNYLGYNSVTVWHTHPYYILSEFELPATNTLSDMNVSMMPGERRSEVINLTNASQLPIDITVSITNLPFVGLCQVLPVDTREGRVNNSVLVPVVFSNNLYRINIPAGVTRQIWLRINPEYDTESKAYSGMISLLGSNFNQSVALTVNIAPVEFPRAISLDMTYFDYVYDGLYSITDDNTNAAASFLKDGFASMVWCSSATMPLPSASRFDAEGHLTSEPDYSKWDAYISMFPEMKYYGAFTGWWGTVETVFGFPLGSAEFNQAMADWAQSWAAHNADIGLQPGQAAISFIDEPKGDAIGKVKTMMEAFAAGSSSFTLWSDPNAASALESPDGAGLFAAADIICPALNNFRGLPSADKDRYRALTGTGKTLWFYNCSGSTRHFDPSYYRLHAWQCFAEGATGQGFWSFGDDGAPDGSFNEYTAIAKISYTPMYLYPDGINADKQWEAIREGIQDYEYLHMLQTKVEFLEAKHHPSPKVTAARSLIDSIAGDIISSAIQQGGDLFFSYRKNYSTLVDGARIEVLDSIIELDILISDINDGMVFVISRAGNIL